MRLLIVMDDNDAELVRRWQEQCCDRWSARGESDVKIRRLGWLLKLIENLDDSKLSEVDHDDRTRMRSLTMMMMD